MFTRYHRFGLRYALRALRLLTLRHMPSTPPAAASDKAARAITPAQYAALLPKHCHAATYAFGIEYAATALLMADYRMPHPPLYYLMSRVAHVDDCCS